MVDVIKVIAGLELMALTIGFWAFTLLFHVLADWKASAMGRHFMSFMICCDLVLTWVWIAFTITPPAHVRVWVALALYGALAVVVWRQVRILIRMQIMSRENSPPIPAPRVMEDTNGQST